MERSERGGVTAARKHSPHPDALAHFVRQRVDPPGEGKRVCGSVRARLALLLALPLAACFEKDVGFVKIVAPAALNTPAYLLHVNAVESGPLKDGAVLRQEVGDTEIELKRNGVTVAACKFTVKKNQRVVVTFSGSNRKCEATS